MKERIDASLLSSILVKAQAGDADARNQLARALMNELAPIVARAARCAPRADRDDVVQETFLLLIEPRVAFNPGRGSPYAYCFQTARSAADYRGRERGRARHADLDLDTLEVTTVDTPRAEARNELRAARAVDAVMFKIVTTIVYDGATAKEAGWRFGMTPSKVCRARQAYAARCRLALRAAP